MSEDYVTVPPLSFLKLRRLRLRSVWNDPKDSDPLTTRLTDGKDSLWAFCTPGGYSTFSLYGANSPEAIIAVLEKRFGVRFVSEHQRGYVAASRKIDRAEDAKGKLYYQNGWAKNALADGGDRQVLIGVAVEALAAGKGISGTVLKALLAHKAGKAELLRALKADPQAHAGHLLSCGQLLPEKERAKLLESLPAEAIQSVRAKKKRQAARPKKQD